MCKWLKWIGGMILSKMATLNDLCFGLWNDMAKKKYFTIYLKIELNRNQFWVLQSIAAITSKVNYKSFYKISLSVRNSLSSTIHLHLIWALSSNSVRTTVVSKKKKIILKLSNSPCNMIWAQVYYLCQVPGSIRSFRK